MKPDTIAVVSGGLDSTTLIYYLIDQGKTPALISFRYGQRHDKEVGLASEHAVTLGLIHRVIDLTSLSDLWTTSSLIDKSLDIPLATSVSSTDQPSTYVPNRNMIFLSLAIAWAETLDVSEVYYGAQKHDIYGYWDTTLEFVKQVNTLYRLSPTPIRVVAPFLDFSKADVLRVGVELGVDYSRTWSCYAGDELACGICPTCVERLKAFGALGITDPVLYRHYSTRDT